MNAMNDGGPAFPSSHNDGDGVRWYNGMSLRDYFAAKAMLGEIINQGLEGRDLGHIAGMSYEIADAMLKAREVKS